MALALQDGKLVAITLDGITKISCQCCIPLQFVYTLNPSLYGGILQCVTAFGGTAGLCCGYAPYLSISEESPDGEVFVAEARQDGIWSSSVNIELYAIWYAESDTIPTPQPYPGGILSVTYLGTTKSISIPTMVESLLCDDLGLVATITVFSSQLGDGSFFKFA